jgi:hypothetical protein
VNGTRSATITIRIRDAVTGALPPDGAAVTVSTTLGELGVAGSGAQTAAVAVQQGIATVLLFPGDELGNATVTARLEDSFGQLTVPIVASTGTPTPPVFFLERVEPDEGSPEGGEIVRILGQEIETPVRVTFGGNPAEVLGVTSDSIRVRTPRNDNVPAPPAVGRLPVDVVVTINVNEVDEDSDTLVQGFTYTRGDVGVQPVIFSVTPNIGPNEGGTRVTINGDGFQAPVQVLFEGGASIEAQVESVSRTQIVAISPPATGFGSVNKDSTVGITVRNLTNGLEVTRQSAFTYGIEFTIFEIEPTEGPFFGGTRVTIFGEGFDEPLVVDFGDVRQQVTSVTGNQIVVRSQPVDCSAAGGGEVAVTHLETDRRAANPNNASFSYFGLEITGVTPLFIGQAGGNITISGRPFRSPTRGSIRGAANERPITITNVSEDSISAIVPAFSNVDFDVEACDDNNDDFEGQRFVTTEATLRIIDEQSACSATFTINIEPSDTTCRNDVAPDRDLDGVPDSIDNCPTDSNPSQADLDGDGDGDDCDADIDGDGDPNGQDNCPEDANPGQENSDGDDLGDVCDPTPMG